MENNENKTPVTEEKKVEEVKTTEEVKKENTTETNAEAKPEKKAKKSLFAREKKPWELEKEKEPLDKKDYICICGFVILFIVALLPYFVRILDAGYDENRKFSLKGEDPKKEQDVPKVRKKLICNKAGTAEGYTYSIDIVNIYENGNAKTNDITYNIVEITDPTLTNDTVVIDEYKLISEISSSGIQATHESGTTIYKITINYDNDQNLIKNKDLSGHFKALSLQKPDYEQNGFTCSEEVMEG